MSKNAYILSWTKEFIAMSEIFSLISKYISIITKQICEKYGYDEQTAGNPRNSIYIRSK